MEQRPLGRTGLKVSEICLGTMTFAGQCDEPTSLAILDKAVSLGVTFIDAADVYPIPPSIETAGKSEQVIGRWLKGKSRDSLVLATKCRMRVGPGPNDEGLSRRHVIASCEASLRRLGTDFIDLYQSHSPDLETPIEETLRAFDDLIRSGKVRYIGCSNYPAWQTALALAASDRLGAARFASHQPRYNILHREIETELLPLCRDQGVGVIVYNPLAGGFLSGKYAKVDQPQSGTRFTLGASGELYRDRYWQRPQFEAVERLQNHFSKRETPLATASVAWVLRQPGITSAIVGASRPEQLEATIAATRLKLAPEDLAACDAAWWSLPRRPGGK